MENCRKNAPVRILQVVTYMGRGGIETMLMNYYRNIDRSKVQFDFLVHRDFKADYDDEIEALGGHIYRVPPMNPLSGKYRRALRDFFAQHKYETVHCHLNYMSGIVLAEAKRAGVKRRIAHAHTANMNPGWKQYVRQLMKFSIPKNATMLAACSKQAGEAVFGGHGFDILANAIDAESFRFSAESRARVREELKLEDAFAIMHVGRFVYPKNHAFLIDVFAEVLKREADAKLILTGDGELRPEIEAKVKELGFADKVLFLGTRGDVAELLQAADVFAFPSHFEGLPVTIIEAQAAGLPCVKSNTVTDECVLTDLVTSLPIDDPVLWAEEILKKRGFVRRDTLKDIAAGGYDITAAAEKLENFYLNGAAL